VLMIQGVTGPSGDISKRVSRYSGLELDSEVFGGVVVVNLRRKWRVCR
jgi:hypothetical protein